MRKTAQHVRRRVPVQRERLVRAHTVPLFDAADDVVDVHRLVEPRLFGRGDGPDLRCQLVEPPQTRDLRIA